MCVLLGKLPKNSKKKLVSYTDLRRKGIKKPRKGEINYFPEVPDGETMDSLMAHKDQLLNEFRKREPNKNVLDTKMALTYCLRRQEIIKTPTTLGVYKEEWPMLFSPEMLSSTNSFF